MEKIFIKIYTRIKYSGKHKASVKDSGDEIADMLLKDDNVIIETPTYININYIKTLEPDIGSDYYIIEKKDNACGVLTVLVKKTDIDEYLK